MTIDADLTWTPHVDQVCKQFSSDLFGLRRLKNIPDIITARAACFGLFEAHIWYGILAWSGTSKMNMERSLVLQMREIRIPTNCQGMISCRGAFKELRIMTGVCFYTYCTRSCILTIKMG